VGWSELGLVGVPGPEILAKPRLLQTTQEIFDEIFDEFNCKSEDAVVKHAVVGGIDNSDGNGGRRSGKRQQPEQPARRQQRKKPRR
jgi:hypothetical protein